MDQAGIDPIAYLQERIRILKAQIEEIDAEIESRKKDHELIITALSEAKSSYRAALTNERALERLSLGKDFTERRQRMHQIIRGVNTGIFDELRTYKAFLKSLNAERRRIGRELNVLTLRLGLLGEV